MNRFVFHTPASTQEALALLREHGDEARVIVGGTALVILMKQGLVQPGHLVSLSRLESLGGIRQEDGALRIGALVTHREAETSPLLRAHAPALAATFADVATVRIRNQATVGGNVAHGDPALDPPVTLTALDASVQVASADGERLVPLDTFYRDYYETALRPDEIVTGVYVPALPAASGAAYLKFLPRTQDDYATVGVAARLTLAGDGQSIADARVALGAVGSTTLRARAVENALRGQPATEAVFREAARAVRAEVDPISDSRGTAAYKRDMAEVFVRRGLVQALRALSGGADLSPHRNGRSQRDA